MPPGVLPAEAKAMCPACGMGPYRVNNGGFIQRHGPKGAPCYGTAVNGKTQAIKGSLSVPDL